MQGIYQYYNVSGSKFIHSDFIKQLAENQVPGKPIHVAVTVTNAFDEWDIERYVEHIQKLPIDVLYIALSDDDNHRLTYHKTIELNDALEHFAEYQGYNEETGCKEYQFGEMKICFKYKD